ncbi:hypothetical protein Lser_V15G16635 [Lactuca serriola]
MDVYVEVEKSREQILKDPGKSLAALLGTINGLFLSLKAAIGHFNATHQIGFFVDGSYSFPLMFETLPDVNQESSQWTDCEIRDAINLIYLNINKLDVYLSLLFILSNKPSMHYCE